MVKKTKSSSGRLLFWVIASVIVLIGLVMSFHSEANKIKTQLQQTHTSQYSHPTTSSGPSYTSTTPPNPYSPPASVTTKPSQSQCTSNDVSGAAAGLNCTSSNGTQSQCTSNDVSGAAAGYNCN